MDWVMNHFDALFLIAIVLLAFVQKFMRARGTGDRQSPAADSEQAERTRRIQEEIRRRILERRGLAGEPVAEADRSDVEPVTPAPPIMEASRRLPEEPVGGESRETPAVAGNATELERQRRMLQRWEGMNQTAGVEVEASAILIEAAPVQREEFGLRAELRNRDGLRRAVILREILGPPLGLR